MEDKLIQSRRRLFQSAVVFVGSSLMVFCVLESLAWLHARNAVDNVAKEAIAAVENWTIGGVVSRYLHIMHRCDGAPTLAERTFMSSAGSLTPGASILGGARLWDATKPTMLPEHLRFPSARGAPAAPSAQSAPAGTESRTVIPPAVEAAAERKDSASLLSCFDSEVRTSRGALIFKLWPTFVNFVIDTVANATTIAGFIFLVQLLTGAAAAGVVMERFKLTVGVPLIDWPVFVLLMMGLASVLSYPVLWVMYVGASVFKHAIPDHSILALYGGSASAIIFACAGHALPSALHQLIDRHLARRLDKPDP